MVMFTHSEIEQMLQKGIKMLQAIEIPVSDSICPTIDFPKATSFFGQCATNRVRGYKFLIRISEYALYLSERDIMDTILHELLHTCDGCMNHQKLWRTYALQVNLK